MESLIDIRNLRVAASTGNGAETEIVKSVSFAVKRGEVMGLIGESGSGKTTVALAVMGYTRYGCRISGGSIRIGETEVTALDAKALAGLRGRRVAYIAQSAAAAFNPSRMIMAQVIESALIHGTASKAEAMAKAVGLFRALAIPNPETIGRRYPHQVSGGQLQRLMAAMALITDPEVVIFDEPTTALDVTTQIEVLKAFKNAIRERNTTGIYVTHDLPVIAQIADRITVLRNGEVQESGDIGQLIASPKTEYTKSLLAAAEPVLRLVAHKSEPAIPLLEVSGVAAGYGELDAEGLPTMPVLRDIDLVIAPGRALGVVGESGCGKAGSPALRRGDFRARYGRRGRDPRSHRGTEEATRVLLHVHQPRHQNRACGLRRRDRALCRPNGGIDAGIQNRCGSAPSVCAAPFRFSAEVAARLAGANRDAGRCGCRRRGARAAIRQRMSVLQPLRGQGARSLRSTGAAIARVSNRNAAHLPCRRCHAECKLLGSSR